jgi:hypothetical protein
MRQNRALLLKEYWPRNANDVLEVVKLDHPLNVAYRQVTTYWEMAFAFCWRGALSSELLLDSSMEGLYIYARIEPYLAELRAATHARTLRATEWIANETESGREVMGIQRARVKRMLEQRG